MEYTSLNQEVQKYKRNLITLAILEGISFVMAFVLLFTCVIIVLMNMDPTFAIIDENAQKVILIIMVFDLFFALCAEVLLPFLIVNIVKYAKRKRLLNKL